MSNKGRSTPRVVCCAIPIARSAGKVLLVTSRKRKDSWVCEWPLLFLILRGMSDYLSSNFNYKLSLRAQTNSVPKGGWEPSDGVLEAAASREALEEAGVRGTITRFVTTIPSASSTYHFYELDVADLDPDWLESGERRREWVDYAEAVKRIAWKSELVQALALSSIAPKR
ncbi:unnamed protein product [Somion occarium]|uniref:Nudix hydrolase domain-containing protein n=1 Tax=Somion occarium TaxID=3059160 RepID=A0ABP1E872_9APHY